MTHTPTTVLYVCTSCRAGLPVPDGATCAGQTLFDTVQGLDLPDGVVLRGVECLSACDHGCSVALSKAGGWSYVYGRMTPQDAPEILRGAALFAASADGLVPWQDRPAVFRKHTLARVPPMAI
jgi:predicted metal-binding protein